MEGRCERHLFDRAVDLCGHCGGEYCPDCLVYSFGPKKPPFCLPCAVARSGVRSSANNYKPLSGRQQRLLKRRRAELQHQPAPAAGSLLPNPLDAQPDLIGTTSEVGWFAAAPPASA